MYECVVSVSAWFVHVCMCVCVCVCVGRAHRFASLRDKCVSTP